MSMLSIFFLIYMNLIRILEWDLETANSKIKKLLIAHLKDIKNFTISYIRNIPNG